MLVGDRDYLARKQRNWFDLPHFRFMFFNRNEIHIQASVDFINGKLMSGHSSSSTFHDLRIFIISDYQKIKNSKFQNFKKSKIGHTHMFHIFVFFEFQISMEHLFPYFPRMFPDFLDFVQVFWYNKIKKYGAPRPKKSRNHEILSF